MPKYLVLFAALAMSCTSDPIAPDGGSTSDTPLPIDARIATGAWSFETIETRTAPLLGATVTIDLVRAHRPDGATSYLAYEHATLPSAGVVVMTQPYSGIDWTGEDVDARWAAL